MRRYRAALGADVASLLEASARAWRGADSPPAGALQTPIVQFVFSQVDQLGALHSGDLAAPGHERFAAFLEDFFPAPYAALKHSLWGLYREIARHPFYPGDDYAVHSMPDEETVHLTQSSRGKLHLHVRPLAEDFLAAVDAYAARLESDPEAAERAGQVLSELEARQTAPPPLPGPSKPGR